MAAETKTFPATIARVNGHGFQTREDPGRWFNLSKYASPPPTIPPIGTECQITVDGAGFVRAIAPVDASAHNTEPPQANRAGPPSKDVSIIRMNALKCASRLLGPDADTEAALALAERLEAWITRAP